MSSRAIVEFTRGKECNCENYREEVAIIAAQKRVLRSAISFPLWRSRYNLRCQSFGAIAEN